MRMGTESYPSQKSWCARFFLITALVSIFLVLSGSQRANALPAFARKYGLRCSACHETWPILNNFGLKFRDNGYQIMNDRDSPIWQNPSYWPVTFRITPIWHRLSATNAVDTYTNTTIANPTGTLAVERITSTGFDLSGLDFHTGGTLEKNISFYVLPSSDSTATFHFETVMARFDNILGSSWLNVKMGRFELNNLLSEKRMVQLTGNGGIYQTYHFIPVGDGNIFGQMGSNQLGAEYMGHSYDDRTRISAALLTSSDGNENLITSSNAYNGFFTFDQGIDLGKLGVDRLGGYAFVGEAGTYYRTSGGTPIAGSGIQNKSFNRFGFTGQFYFGPHFDVNFVTQHGSDNAWFGQGYGNPINPGSAENGIPGCPPIPTCLLNNTPGTTLPVGSLGPTWNGYTVEARYVYSPQLIFIGEYEAERMSRQANGPNYLAGFTGPNGITGPAASNLGNINNYDGLIRYNPFMSSRAGMALEAEFNLFHQIGTGPLGTNVNTSELLIGWDIDF
jgi:hypothetical protein